MKNIKKKGLLVSSIILAVFSLGYVVNSQYMSRSTPPQSNNENKVVDSIPYAYTRNEKPFEQNVLSNNEFITTLDASNNYGKYQFKTDGSDFDGITATAIPGYEPWNQLWDGLTDTEKSEMTLITKNTKIKKEIKDKKTGKFLPIKGVKFCQYLGTVTEDSPRQNTYDKKLPDGKILKLDKQYCSEPTNEKGETWLQIDEMEYGESYLIEEYTPNKTFLGTTNKPIELKQPAEPTKIYVDLGVRFLGETDGADLISYQDLRKTLREGGKDIGWDLKFNENDGQNGKWLKIYDIRTNKVIYIAKKPLTYKTSWNKLCVAGVVFGLDQVSADGTPQAHFKTPENCGETYKPKIIKRNNRTYIVRLLKTTKENKPNENLANDLDIFKTKIIMGSEWNRYILPLVKDYRYGIRTKEQLEESLKKGGSIGYLGNKNFDIQLADYNWFGDLTLGTIEETDIHGYNGQITWVQEFADKSKRALRGGNDINWGASTYFSSYPTTHTSISYGFRPVLEEIPQNCYDGACFEGEVAGTDFITYKELLEDIEGKSLETLPKDTTTNKPKTKVGDVLDLGNDEATGGNWLKIQDYKNNATLYIAKKPITNKVSWNALFNAGVVYGLDQIDVKDDGSLVAGSKYTGSYGYNPKGITVNGKKYIVRLLKGRTLTINDGNVNKGFGGNSFYHRDVFPYTEWTRYIIPLIDTSGCREGKYGSDSIEGELKLKTTENEYKYELAKYKWFKDLTLQEGKNKLDEYVGQSSWTQEVTNYNSWNRDYDRVLRGDYSFNDCSTGGYARAAKQQDSSYGFRPVLEELKE